MENYLKNKEVKVVLVGNARKEYEQLIEIVEKEAHDGKNKSEHQKILDSITRTVNELKNNPQYGIQVQKKKIPKEYIQQFQVKNLWRCNLANFWRLVYWIDGSKKIIIISFVVDIINHKMYNKRFKYRKS